MARSGVCFGAKAVLDGQISRPPMSPVVLTDNQEQQRLNVKKWNSAHKLWKLKASQPHLFSNFSSEQPVPTGPERPPGFEPLALPSGAHAPGWLYSRDEQLFLEEASDRCLWYDSTCGSYRDIHSGEDFSLDLKLTGAATTSASTPSAASKPANSVATSTSSRSQPPRHLVIMDLHKAAEVFKLDFNHIDRPAAMLAVYRSADGAVPPEIAARGLHEKLLRQLAVSRSMLSNEALQAVLVQCIASLAVEQQTAAAGVAGAVALILGARLVAAVSRGAACAIGDSLPGDLRDIRILAASPSAASVGTVTACAELDSKSSACVLLHTEPFQEDVARVAAEHMAVGHLRAGAVSILQGLSTSQASVPSSASGGTALATKASQSAAAAKETSAKKPPARAAACARLAWSSESLEEPAAKRPRTDKEPDKVRCRRILLKYVGCKKAMDEVRRKPVRRSLDEAEAAMLGILNTLNQAVANGSPGTMVSAFTQQCRANSECAHSLKGGDLAGDVGWLKLPEVKPGEKIPKELAARMALIRTALSLDVGEVSDILVSEDGVLLLKRSA